METGDTMLEAAIATFSHKLGVAMARLGDAIGAEGVLREAMELTEPVSPQRARMMVGLAKMVATRKRFRDAFRLLDQTLEITRQLGNDAARAEAYLGVAWVRNEQGDKAGTAEALKTACELLAGTDASAPERALAEVELASNWLEIGELQKARAQLGRAERLAREAEAPHLLARISLMLARLEARCGDHKQSYELYHKAIRFAVQAGDADTVQACEQALSAMGRDSPTALDLAALHETQPSARKRSSDAPTGRSERPDTNRISAPADSHDAQAKPSGVPARISVPSETERKSEPSKKRGDTSRP